MNGPRGACAPSLAGLAPRQGVTDVVNHEAFFFVGGYERYSIFETLGQ